MGEAKRRRDAGIVPIPTSRERQLVASAATHFYNHFVRPICLVGGCYYVSMALRYYLGSVHGLNVAAIAGFSRPQISGYRWSSHMWIEFEHQPTDITICMAMPPDFPGRLLIDGKERGDGVKTLYSKDRPTDGILVDIDMSDQVGELARKEHSFFTNLALEGLSETRRYLMTAPPEQQMRTEQAWRAFKPSS